MTFQALALVLLAGLLGPLLASWQRLSVPIVFGEIAAGVLLGDTGARTLHPTDRTFAFLAELGFALVMFVAGSHVPMRDPRLRSALGVGVARAGAVAVLAVGAGAATAAAFGTGHAAVYAVLMASSSAALVLPVLDALGLSDGGGLSLLPQVAVADAACTVAVPLVVDPSRAGRAALGALAVIVSATAVFFVMRWAERTGVRRRLHRVSQARKFALELRVSLVVLCALAAVAVSTHVSVMLAGFTYGIAVSAVGEPRRLARQLFAVTEGFLAPVFFVWLGASLDLRALAQHPSYLLLGAVLGGGAVLCHVAVRLVGQPIAYGALAAAQLGVPIAVVTVAAQLHTFAAGEPAGIILGAVVTVVVAAAASSALGKQPAGDTAPSRDAAATGDAATSRDAGTPGDAARQRDAATSRDAGTPGDAATPHDAASPSPVSPADQTRPRPRAEERRAGQA